MMVKLGLAITNFNISRSVVYSPGIYSQPDDALHLSRHYSDVNFVEGFNHEDRIILIGT